MITHVDSNRTVAVPAGAVHPADLHQDATCTGGKGGGRSMHDGGNGRHCLYMHHVSGILTWAISAMRKSFFMNSKPNGVIAWQQSKRNKESRSPEQRFCCVSFLLVSVLRHPTYAAHAQIRYFLHKKLACADYPLDDDVSRTSWVLYWIGLWLKSNDASSAPGAVEQKNHDETYSRHDTRHRLLQEGPFLFYVHH